VASYKTTSTASTGTFAAGDLMIAFYALKGDYAPRATWLINRAMVGYIRRFTDATSGQFLWQPGMVAGTPDTLLGRPIVEATDMASAVAGSAVVAILGDFKRGYKIVDRIGMTVQRDPYTQATAGNVRFIARKRVDGKVVLPEAFRLLACSA
jgi:HK97 family phage major capsid protein